MSNIYLFLKEVLYGRKTYLVAVVSVGYALAGLWLGYLSQDEAVQYVFAGLGLGSLRAAVDKK